MIVSRRVSWFLVAFGVWSWVIWPTFLKNIWADKRSWHDGMTAFFAVHLVLTVVSLALGTAIGVLGARGLLSTRRHGGPAHVDQDGGRPGVPRSVPR
ncbi:SCO4848 family membrane protein [uncultured Jatrophihabitans sp.]|uniref:SCO4848 family membrane protein n=1 Tax=uncultured Jatrophihabitans sp. TaxID=1610747 RepID=UPI0035CB744A